MVTRYGFLHITQLQTAYRFAQDMCDQQLAELMKQEMEIIKVMSKPSYMEKDRRKSIVANGMSPRKFERDETLLLLRRYRQVLARTSVVGVKKVILIRICHQTFLRRFSFL